MSQSGNHSRRADSRGRRRRGSVWLVLVVAVLVLSACGDARSSGNETGEPATTPSPGASAVEGQPTEASSPDVAAGFLISADELPSGWRDSDPPNSSFRMTVCGVDTEPTPPVEVAQVRFAQTAVGPFLYQYVRTYADAQTPAAVARDLAAGLPGCAEFTTRGTAQDSPEARFDLEPLEVDGLPAGAVAWRMTPQVELPMIQDVVFVPIGTSLVAFLSASMGEAPDPAALTAAVRALQGGS